MDRVRDDRALPRWLLLIAVLALVGYLVYLLRGVLTPVFFAFLIAYLLDPVVDRFEARGLPRSLGIAVMLTVVLGALVLFLVLAVPVVIRDVVDFAAELPEDVARISAVLEGWLGEYGVELPHSVGEAAEQMQLDGQRLADAAAPVGAALAWLLGGTMSVLGAMLGALMVPVFAAYLLYDFDRMTAGIRDLTPLRWRPFVVDVAGEVDEVLGEFIRGQLIIMLILAVLYATAYALLGVKLAIVIGLVAGLLAFIPYVGGAVALGLAVIMCLVDWGGWGQLAGVVIAYSVIQVLEGFVITPRIVGDKVGLSAVWVLFALMVGGELFDFLGVLLGVPAAAVIKVFVVRGLGWYRKSRWLNDPGTPETRSFVAALLREEGLPDDAETRARKMTGASDPAEALELLDSDAHESTKPDLRLPGIEPALAADPGAPEPLDRDPFEGEPDWPEPPKPPETDPDKPS